MTLESEILLISPVRNEAAHIERVARSVAEQGRPPSLWIVGNDGSTDETLPLLRSLESELAFLRVVDLRQERLDAADRLALALEAKAFNRLLELADWRRFSHIGKLDGDIELPSDYFERILASFEQRPNLGIAGGSIVEATGRGGRWVPVTAPESHVHGAMKLYSRRCFAEIGGIRNQLGWDSIDEIYARMHGYETRRDLTLVARHHRPSGSADGALRGRARHGECAYIAWQGPLWASLRGAKTAWRVKPRPWSGLAFVIGYFAAMRRKVPRVDDPAFRSFVRAELRARPSQLRRRYAAAGHDRARRVLAALRPRAAGAHSTRR
jgi:poly-beta-1,6-N-acetyl-D-glucosamine synthase